MTSSIFLRLSIGFYILLFFSYLFGPLIVMSITAFNSAGFPRLSPWDCFSTEWFAVLFQDDKLMTGLKNSIIVGVSVVLVSVPMGLAGALVLGQLNHRMRSIFYTLTISPILVPGVVLGISTLIFWDRMGNMFGANYETFFYDGIFLTIIGQSTFISAYTMLVFISRLQRFDPVLEEAALDLGASNVQTFRKILLPFLKPALASSAVLAFLASFENYNTTVFTIVSESTITTVLASKVRYGINPSISALAVIIIALTLIGAFIHEVFKRREHALAIALKNEGQPIVAKKLSKNTFLNPVPILVVMILVAGMGSVWLSRGYDVNQCKVEVTDEKRKKSEALKKIRMAEMQKKLDAQKASSTAAKKQETPKAQLGTSAFGNIFSATNLSNQVKSENKTVSEKEIQQEKEPEKTSYNNIFAPTNLKQQVETDQ